ncbi:hypothetical protein VC83_04072 [Pseudogymnoascus destructans]|uniref:DUF7924 domain-containing protein n=2 Tax=Pseudogymnoascus destructans TaxID=655981 RepID=L8G7H1_PSED2|nr:uncharacterized protein VC83_04072 [Pseudogymnoascus destructans]ELR08578.1 hypothetical protein GMDG_03273 [Pseudogymnoascus destructans 20631-21]OAF59541.1 hypothetical protein VC83_04072 [Pseudogymnoascus destructans]
MGFAAKRSHAEFRCDTANCQTLFSYPSPAPTTLFSDPPPSIPSRTRSFRTESGDKDSTYEQKVRSWQAKEQFHTSRRREKSPLPLLRRSASLPTLSELRSLPLIAPLTQQNLLSAEGEMDPRLAGAPATPQKSVSSISQTYDTPSQASHASSSVDVGAKLEIINIFGHETSTPILQKLPDFKAEVLSVVSGERLSAMKPQSAKRFRSDFNDVKSRNEATLHDRMMPHMIKSGRTVSGGENADELYKEFREDGLDRNIDADFSAGCVPIPPCHAFEKNLERLFGVKNPKPDFTFGFNPSTFTKDEQLLLQRYDTSYALSKGIISPFFIMEWKGSRGTMQDCSVQARRGGAAIVNARRQIRASTIPDYDYFTPDLATIAFSCAMTSEIAYIAVHWCQRIADNDYWYMAVAKRFFLAEDDDIQRLRLCLHNIIDWGLSERRNSIKEELRALDERWQIARSRDLETQQGSVSKRRRKE